MKNTFALLTLMLFLCLQLKAQTSSNKLSLNLKDKPIAEFVSAIEKQCPYRFYYNETHFRLFKVSLSLNNASLEQVLNKAFEGTDYHYAIFEKSVFLTKSVQIITSTLSTSPVDVNAKNLNSPLQLAADLSDDAKAVPSIENQTQLIGEPNTKGRTKFKISGTIKNADTGEPLPDVTVSVNRLQIVVVTDAYGFYSLDLPPGEHTMSIKAMGLAETRRQIKVLGDGAFPIRLSASSLILDEVTIAGNKSTNVTGTQMGVEKLDIKTIKQIPTVFGEADILRAVLTLPGVKSVGESSAGFNVRGGATDQNLVLFDGATVYNPTHFFGFFSAFSPEIIEDIQLFKGSIPAKFGGRLSSVLELNVKEGNQKEFKGTAGIGLLTSRIHIEGPIIKDQTSFTLGGRTTYSNWITNLLPKNSAYRNAQVSFYDMNLSINHHHNKNNSFSAIVYFSSDQSDLGTDTTFKYANRNLSLKWKHTFNQKFYSTISAGRDEYSYNNFSTYQEEVDYRLRFDIAQTRFKTNFNYSPQPRINIEFGTNSIYYDNHPGRLDPYNDRSLVVSDVIAKEQGMENAVFIEQRFELTPSITLNTGLRYSAFTSLGPSAQRVYAPGLDKSDANVSSVIDYKTNEQIKTYHGPEYRLAATFLLNPSLSIKTGYHTQRQYIHMLSNTTSLSPTDVWKLSDLNIAPQQGQQISLGVYKNFASNTIETSVEVYYKKIKDFLDYKSGATLLLNHKIEQDVLPTQGKAYGIEFLIKKQVGKVNGWLSYTYSRTMLRTPEIEGVNSINQGQYYPANYDKPHDATLVGNYRFSQRVSVSLNMTYSTGRPITLPVGKYFYNGGQRLLYSDRNQYRIPDYFRSDISLNILGNHKVKQLTHNSWTIGVYNLTNRKNAFSTFFVSENKVINGYRLSIFGSAIPFINYNIRFR